MRKLVMLCVFSLGSFAFANAEQMGRLELPSQGFFQTGPIQLRKGQPILVSAEGQAKERGYEIKELNPPVMLVCGFSSLTGEQQASLHAAAQANELKIRGIRLGKQTSRYYTRENPNSRLRIFSFYSCVDSDSVPTS